MNAKGLYAGFFNQVLNEFQFLTLGVKSTGNGNGFQFNYTSSKMPQPTNSDPFRKVSFCGNCLYYRGMISEKIVKMLYVFCGYI
jgi:hypothetical protein